MSVKKLLAVVMMLFVFSSVAASKKSDASVDAQSEISPEAGAAKSSLQGDWFAQIDIPDNRLTIVLEFNLSGESECVIKCAWIDSENEEVKVEASGKATYRVVDGDKLEIKFLNSDERIREDNIFAMTNIYNFELRGDKMIILDNPQFRNVDIEFGKGYDNREFSTITF